MNFNYHFQGTKSVITPALIYYRDIIEENTQKAISLAGGAEKLWPHVKSHKSAALIHLQMDMGITRFKCATIAEAEMVAACKASHVLLSYPLVGPNIDRFLSLIKAFPHTVFWAIADNLEQARLLGDASKAAGHSTNVLVDVNMGMDRTGVPLDQLERFYKDCVSLEGLSLKGLHCYDGHRTESLFASRKDATNHTLTLIQSVVKELTAEGLDCSTLIIGGTPSFPCYTELSDCFFSPGTLFLHDHGYQNKFPDLNFIPGAAILTRVVSHPKEGYFTLDLGYKGIAADPAHQRGIIVGLDHIEELFQSEEHWTYKMKSGYEDQRPEIGSELLVIPTHICPTSALYPHSIVVSDGKIVDQWEITARNRKITY